MADTDLYNADFYAWLQQQAILLASRQFEQLDVGNVIEETTSLAANQKTGLREGVRNALINMILLHAQPSLPQSAEWYSTVVEAQIEIEASTLPSSWQSLPLRRSIGKFMFDSPEICR